MFDLPMITGMVRSGRQKGAALPWIEPPTLTFASRLGDPLIKSLRQGNDAVWADAANWRFGFYFGAGDRRLWVPRRLRDGRPDRETLVINFSHPLGKRAWRVLQIAYGVGTLAVGVLTVALIQATR